MIWYQKVTGPDVYLVCYNGGVFAGEFTSELEAVLWCANNHHAYQYQIGIWTLHDGFAVRKVKTINVDAIYKGAKNVN